MNKTDITLVAVSFVVFISAPFLPTPLYKMAFSNVIVPFILLAGLLLTLRTNPIGAVTLLVAVMALFVEYRNRVISTSAPSTKPPAYEEQLAPAPVIVPGEVHPEPKQPRGPMVSYRPTEDSTDAFSAVGASVNEKKVMDSPRTTNDTNQFMIEHGLTS